ncbi:hypothetical protein BRD02_08720 [Halobacteriales archaeon QS_8_69_73]|nr:MAG: hypothetical protein BRD02_08720 [Halobacteriales archaeon QS_8_69_73]
MESYNEEQRDVGQQVASEVPAGATVCVAEDVERQSITTVSFYADRPLERADRDRTDSDRAVKYAVATTERADRLDRPPLRRRGGLTKWSRHGDVRGRSSSVRSGHLSHCRQ